MYIDYLKSPIGIIEITADDVGITSVAFVEKETVPSMPSELTSLCKTQLQEYFEGNRRIFNLPLKFIGTDFQQKVWNMLQLIPFSTIESYKSVAEKISNPKAVRAVGNANNKNKHIIIVPCHRVLGSSGKLVGYGAGLWRKEWLLKHEGLIQ